VLIVVAIIPTGYWGHWEADKKWSKTDGVGRGEYPMPIHRGKSYFKRFVYLYKLD
jgi:hypothetical protein